MLKAQHIYGPHGDAVWASGEIAIGRALYELLPEDVHDRGPIEGGGGRYRVVADIRLDNREVLADELGINAADARLLPDAAFVVRAWERWGEECFAHLYGDYAFALWDRDQCKLMLARDALGGKPLHYHRGDGFLAFASMPKGLHTLPEVPLAPDEVRAAELLALIPEWGPRSFFKDVSRVEPGQFIVFDTSGQRARRHWHPPGQNRATRWQLGDAVEALRAELDRAVAVRLRGGGARVGAHLSAGLDSSAVAATAARLLAPLGGEVVAFTSVPRHGYIGEDADGRISDEGPLAAKTAALYANIEHLLIRPDEESTVESWDRDFFLHDRPLVNPCNQRWINAINAEAQRRNLSVVLTGAMGNMTLSYAGTELLPELLVRFRWLALLRELAALVAAGSLRWRGGFALALGPWMPSRLWRVLSRHSASLHEYSAVRPEYVREAQLFRLAKARELDFNYRPRKNAVGARLWVLGRIDQANATKAALAGYGVDMRDPTADRKLIEFCMTLPTSMFLREGEFRVLGRRALADRLPGEVLEERRRGYQAADWHESLRAGREALQTEINRLEHVPAAGRILDLSNLREALDNWPSDGWSEPQVTNKYRFSLLRGGNVGHFLRRASRSNA
jgi:asparagine synthase (glutamine-hydrolysing)